MHSCAALPVDEVSIFFSVATAHVRRVAWRDRICATARANTAQGKGSDVLELGTMFSVVPWAELLLPPFSWKSGNVSLPDMMQRRLRGEAAGGGLSRYNAGAGQRTRRSKEAVHVRERLAERQVADVRGPQERTGGIVEEANMHELQQAIRCTRSLGLGRSGISPPPAGLASARR